MKKVYLGMLTGSSCDKLEQAKNLGADYVDLHFKNDDELIEALNKAWEIGLKTVINVEGRPLDWVPSEKLSSMLKDNDNFLGFMLDECDHMQLHAHWPVVEYYGYNENHFFAETCGMDLDTAQKTVQEAIKKRVEDLTIGKGDVSGEFLFPGMMHTAAQAGLCASPKILKETYGPVMIAAGIGAALEYGGTFGIDVDAWWHPETVGHSDKRFDSALKLAYWCGADRVYIEGGFGGCGHPSEETQPQIFGEFAKHYVPDHPRDFSWRDYKPEIAIIRQDDGCFDIRQRYVNEYPGPMYGHIPVETENTEWLNILSLLSHGYIRNDSATHNWESRSVQSRILFAPLYKLAIFDEKVTGEPLNNVKLFFLTGPKISHETMEEVKNKVKNGAVCVMPERLSHYTIKNDVECFSDGKGEWIIVKDLYSLHYETWTSGPCNKLLRDKLMPLIGDGETLIYDFGKYIVKIKNKKADFKLKKEYVCQDIPRAVIDIEDELIYVCETN